MPNYDPVKLLSEIDVKLLQVDEATTGNALIHGTSEMPLAGQITEFTPGAFDSDIREVQTGGVAPAEVWRMLSNSEVSFISTRFSGDWWALMLKKIQIRASASLEDLIPIGATSYYHELTGRVSRAPEETWSNTGDPAVKITLKFLEAYEVVDAGSSKWKFDRPEKRLVIAGTDWMADRRKALGLV